MFLARKSLFRSRLKLQNLHEYTKEKEEGKSLFFCQYIYWRGGSLWIARPSHLTLRRRRRIKSFGSVTSLGLWPVSSWLVGWSDGRSVMISLEGAGSFTLMLLSEHLFSILALGPSSLHHGPHLLIFLTLWRFITTRENYRDYYACNQSCPSPFGSATVRFKKSCEFFIYIAQ